MDDFQISQTTRDANRLVATNPKLLVWFQDSLEKQVAPLVSAVAEPYAKQVKELSLAAYEMEHESLDGQASAPDETSSSARGAVRSGNVSAERRSVNDLEVEMEMDRMLIPPKGAVSRVLAIEGSEIATVAIRRSVAREMTTNRMSRTNR